MSKHMIRGVDNIGAMCNGHVPGVDDTHLENTENVLQDKILNVTVEVSKPLCVYVQFPGVLCLKDHLSGRAS